MGAGEVWGEAAFSCYRWLLDGCIHLAANSGVKNCPQPSAPIGVCVWRGG